MKTTAKILLLIALGMPGMQFASAQQGELTLMEEKGKQIEMQLAETLKEKRMLVALSDSIAEDVGELKSDSEKTFGILSRFRLEGKLKETQSIGKRLQACESKITDLRKEYGALAIRIEEAYTGKINALLEMVEQTKDSTQIGSLQELYSKRNEWREKIPEQSSGALILFDVTVDSTDGPRDIKEKADLMKDMEEDVRSKVKLLSRRVNDLKDEKKIRDKMGDFMQEVMVFRDRERGRNVESGLQLTNEIVQKNIDALSGRSSGEGFTTDERGGSSVLTRDQIFRFWETIETLDPANISSQSIDQLIEQYSILMKHLDKRAKDLNEDAIKLYRKAEALGK